MSYKTILVHLNDSRRAEAGVGASDAAGYPLPISSYRPARLCGRASFANSHGFFGTRVNCCRRTQKQ